VEFGSLTADFGWAALGPGMYILGIALHRGSAYVSHLRAVLRTVPPSVRAH
jgi:hypothetical protein